MEISIACDCDFNKLRLKHSKTTQDRNELQYLFEILSEFNHTQMHNEPTREDNLLDLFYRRYFDLISKFQVGLKSLLRQGLSEPDFYGDLVYKLRRLLALIIFQRSSLK